MRTSLLALALQSLGDIMVVTMSNHRYARGRSHLALHRLDLDRAKRPSVRAFDDADLQACAWRTSRHMITQHESLYVSLALVLVWSPRRSPKPSFA